MFIGRDVVVLAVGVLFSIPVLAVPAGAATSCGSIRNPYAGTWYDSVDIRRIHATGVSCATARKVAAGAHSAVLVKAPPADGVEHFRWHGWAVTGDIRGAQDRYVARKGNRVVRWWF
jgi:hypothetical protein